MNRTDIVELCTYTVVYPFGCSFLIRQAGWPVGWDWLLPGVTPNQVQAQEFNRHQPHPFKLPPPLLATPAPPTRLPGPPLWTGLGTVGGSSAPAAAMPASGGVAGVAAASAGVAGVSPG